MNRLENTWSTEEQDNLEWYGPDCAGKFPKDFECLYCGRVFTRETEEQEYCDDICEANGKRYFE